MHQEHCGLYTLAAQVLLSSDVSVSSALEPHYSPSHVTPGSSWVSTHS
jgi:hypothetical protein